MSSETRFRATEGKRFGFRAGAYERDGVKAQTPLFFPIVNILTGPPGVFANGGIWRHIKVELFRERRIPAAMSQILHFTEYGVSLPVLNRWFEERIPARIEKEAGYRPLFFVDSGGYRLLYNTGIDVERYGLHAQVEDVLRLQASFGGDIVATLDYPLPTNLEDVEASERIRRSLENCLRTADLAAKTNDRPLVQMAVHGRSRLEARQMVKRLLTELKQKGYETGSGGLNFGLAIGSLVPLSGSPVQVIEIVHGVLEGIRACDWIDPLRVPVHAFGVSGRMIPLLAAMGVDSFDGTSYVQSAQSLKYLRPGSFTSEPFLELENVACHCRYCEKLNEGGISVAQSVLRGSSFGKVQFGGRETNKSFIYAMIALHNLESSLRLVDRVQEAVSSDESLGEIFAETALDPRVRPALIEFARLFPDAQEFLWKAGISRLRRRLRRNERAMNDEFKSSANSIYTSPPIAKHSVTLTLRPDDFDISKMEYHLPARPILLFLPCSQQKPYSSSPTHKLIRQALRKARIDLALISKVSVSGNYGPVPEEFEMDPRVQSYDFYLNSGDSRRIELLAERTRGFVKNHDGRFKFVVAYCTAKPYRMVIERALMGVPNTFILPAPLKARRASQFRKPENLAQLVQVLRELSREAPTEGTK